MQPISQAFQKALVTGYQSVITANVLSPPVNGANGPVLLAGVPVTDGSVTIDRTAAQRRTFSLTLSLTGALGTSVIPASMSDPFAPFGPELQLFAGWIDPNTGVPYILPSTGLPEQIPLGIFPITTTKVDHAVDITMTAKGYDRSWSVAQRAFAVAQVISAGVAPETAIAQILSSQYPGLPSLNMPPTGFALPGSTYDAGADPFAACLDMATQAGNELYFDANGSPSGNPVPDPTTISPCWTYTVGTGGASSISRVLTREGVSNDIVVSATGSQNATSGTGASTPVSAEAQDLNPQSPTYTYGQFGDVPTFTSSSNLSSLTSAQAAANLLLALSLGSIDVCTITVSPAPMFDIDDVITLIDPQINVSFNAVVDAVTYSLRHDTKTSLTLRHAYPL